MGGGCPVAGVGEPGLRVATVGPAFAVRDTLASSFFEIMLTEISVPDEKCFSSFREYKTLEARTAAALFEPKHAPAGHLTTSNVRNIASTSS